MTTNRKIGKKAAHEIAEKFVWSGEFAAKLKEVEAAEYEREAELDEAMKEIASQSYAKEWYETLSEDDADAIWFNRRYRSNPSVKFATEASVDGETRTITLDLYLDGWWALSQTNLRLLNILGYDATSQGLDLRHTLSEAMKDHPALIAHMKAEKEHREYRNMLFSLQMRIEEDILDRKVKDVLDAWPELTDAIDDYYPQIITQKKPLQTPLANVIASISTPLITSEDNA